MQASFSQLVQIALISGCIALFGGLLGAIISGGYGLRAKRNEYVNDYYKKVIDRRMAAYEQLESLIVPLKTAVVGADAKPYHFLFSQDENNGLLPVHLILHGITSQALWLSDEAFQKTREIDRLLWRFKDSGGTAIEFGQRNYEALATLRDCLERILAADMSRLHDVDGFLKKKATRRDPGLQPWG